MSAFDKASLAALKQFVQLIAANPAVLHTPELSFFKSYLESLGAKIPKAPATAADEGHGHAHGGHGHAHGGADDHGHSHGGEGGGHGHSHGGKACHGHGGDAESKAEGQPMDDDEDDDDEPLEFKFDEPEPTMEAADDKFDDGLETVTADVVDNTVSTVPDMSVEPSDEAIEKAGAEKQAALSALESGDYASAIAHYTTAISLNPASSLLVAGRAAVFLAQKKPNAAIKDANIALQANPDSAKALKIRGKAYTLLGDYENAHKDLSRGLQVDYDDETQQLAKKVQARVDTVHRRVRKLELAKEEWMKRKVIAQRAWIKKKQEWEERRRQREEAMNDDNPYAGAAGGQPNMADFAKMFGGAGGAGGGQPNMADFAKMFGGGGAGGAGGQPNMAEFAKMFGGAGGAGGGAGGPDLSSMFGGAGRGAGPKPAQAAEEVD